MTAQSRRPARWVVVGAGWSGLACAVEAARQGVAVTLVDAAPTLGGRARRVDLQIGDREFTVDNGQHLLLGACTETIGLMRRLGVDPDQALLSQPFTVRYPDGWRFGAAGAPAPLHLALGLLGARRVPWRDRIALAAWVAQQQRNRWQVSADRPVATLLQTQSEALVRRLWRPLCIAAMNAEPAQTSASMFLNLLRLTLGASEPDSRLLLTRRDLSSTMPEAARRYLEQAGATVLVRQLATALARSDRGWSVSLREQRLEADRVVLALPAEPAARLLESASIEALGPAIAGLRNLQYEPIATVYLRYPGGTRLPEPVYALLDEPAQGRPGQWVFDRGRIDPVHQGIFSVVIGAPALRVESDRSALCAAADRQLSSDFGLPLSIAQNIVIERRATLRPDVGLQRPASRLPAEGLYLAGDIADSPFPSTLEGSVRSGLEAARLAMADATSDPFRSGGRRGNRN
ncbi:MAG TPA: hydroxysqualene dehydroxylase HpnE [Burkholderiaceae bacterium]|jgi:squalene-associated FAD-dependent desaturase|nr:hydroxysqualene dehydroxylase HpnE [Burkholderiaceae bacterium]